MRGQAVLGTQVRPESSVSRGVSTSEEEARSCASCSQISCLVLGIWPHQRSQGGHPHQCVWGQQWSSERGIPNRPHSKSLRHRLHLEPPTSPPSPAFVYSECKTGCFIKNSSHLISTYCGRKLSDSAKPHADSFSLVV